MATETASRHAGSSRSPSKGRCNALDYTATFSFGHATRPSPVAAKDSPGPKYDTRPTRTIRALRFGSKEGSRAEIEKSKLRADNQKRATTPGPVYNIVSDIGRAKSFSMDGPGKYHLIYPGVADKRFVSVKHMDEFVGWDSPGPKYDGSKAGIETSRSVSFTAGKRFDDRPPDTPGPGAYSTTEPKSAKGVKMNESEREISHDKISEIMRQRSGVRVPNKPDLPGPGSYELNTSSFNSHGGIMAKSQRQDRDISCSPGPAYALPSTLQHNVGTRFSGVPGALDDMEVVPPEQPGYYSSHADVGKKGARIGTEMRFRTNESPSPGPANYDTSHKAWAKPDRATELRRSKSALFYAVFGTFGETSATQPHNQSQFISSLHCDTFRGRDSPGPGYMLPSSFGPPPDPKKKKKQPPRQRRASTSSTNSAGTGGGKMIERSPLRRATSRASTASATSRPPTKTPTPSSPDTPQSPDTATATPTRPSSRTPSRTSSHTPSHASRTPSASNAARAATAPGGARSHTRSVGSTTPSRRGSPSRTHTPSSLQASRAYPGKIDGERLGQYIDDVPERFQRDVSCSPGPKYNTAPNSVKKASYSERGTFTFGTRDAQAKLHISAQHEGERRGLDSPGPHFYAPKSGFRADAKNGTNFGKVSSRETNAHVFISKEHSNELRGRDTPGPQTYDQSLIITKNTSPLRSRSSR